MVDGHLKWAAEKSVIYGNCLWLESTGCGHSIHKPECPRTTGELSLRKIAGYLVATAVATAILVGTALFYRPALELMAAVVAVSVFGGVFLGGKRRRALAIEALGLLAAIAAATWLAGYTIAQNL